LSEKEVQAIDRAFPRMGFALAFFIAQAGKTSAEQIFDDDSLVPFSPGSGSCRSMKKGTFQDQSYVLKSKKNMGKCQSSPQISYRRAKNEAQAGVQIRQKVVDIFLNERNLNAMSAEFYYLKNIVAPFDCGNYIASVEIPNAITLHDILYADRRQILPTCIPVAGDSSASDIPVPNFSSDDEVLTPRKKLFPHMDFGEAEERILMAMDIIKIVEFLHSCKVAHNDLQPGNFLITGNNYGQLVLIDFDNARFDKKSFSTDYKSITYTIGEYLLGTTRIFSPEQIDASYIEDPETLSYTPEGTERIKEILSNIQ
jgi:hypothetical protein